MCFKRGDLLYERVVHERQFTQDTIIRMKQFGTGNSLVVYRIGDKLSDQLKMPKDKSVRNMISNVICVLTKPEFEVLMLINEGVADRYFRTEKTGSKPSTFYKTLHHDYHKGSNQIKEYFGKMSDLEIALLLQKYEMTRKKTHPNGMLSLYDLLSEETKRI